MRKLIIALITLLVIGAVGYFLIPVENKKKSFGYSEALNAVPQRATFVIRCDNPILKWSQFSSTTIGMAVSQTGSFKGVQAFFSKIDSVNDETMNNFFKEKVFISGVLTAGNQLNQIVSLESGGATKEQVKKYIESILGGAPKSSKDYELHKIHFYSVDNNELCFAQVGDVILFSSSSILIEEGIRSLSAEQHLPDEIGFKKLLKTADLDAAGNFFINFNELGSYLNLFGNSTAGFVKSFEHFGGWAELDLNAKDQSLMLNGFSVISDSTFSFLNSFEGEKPHGLNISSVLPENTGMLTYSSFTSFESYKKKYDQFLSQKQVLYKHQKNVLNINKKHSFNVEADFYGWIGEEIGLFTVNGDEKSYQKNTGLIIKISDLEKAKEGLSEIHKSTGVNRESKYQTLTINDLGLTNFFTLVLGSEYKAITASKYLILEDYIIFANDESVLKHIVNFYLRGKTLVKNIQFNKFYEQFSSESNLFYYCNFKLAENYFNNILKESDLERYKANKDSLTKLQAFGLQVNANKKLFFTNAFINYSSKEESQNISLIEVKLDTTYSKKPWVVANHYTKEKEILIQDDQHTLYLINNVGKILWKKQMSEPIVGDVSQVDRYKNDKFQYSFVTTHKIHQIDRKGRDVSGYPVSLKAPATQGLVVMDYDKNRNYRMLVTQGKNIHNFSIEGKLVKGWKFKSIGEIAVVPTLLQVKGKDYIITSDYSGKVRVLNRKGEDRIKLANQLPTKTKNHFVWKNNALSNSGVLATDTNGTIYYVKLADEMETFALKAFDGDFNVDYNDFNGDGVLDFTVVNDQSVLVFKNNKKILCQISDVEFNPAYGIESFKVKKNGALNIITDKKEQKIYGYDSEGKMLNGFPIEGVSPSLVTDIDNNGVYDLIIGDQLGSVYIYSLGK